jgi:DNA-binding CsgD family transcriptional regulator
MTTPDSRERDDAGTADADDPFLDRLEERRALDSLAVSAREGGSGALVLFGDAGMGKTALLDYAVSTSGLRVVRIAGIETEQGFGFAALHRLLQPFLEGLAQLHDPQRSALQAALGLRDDGPPDRFMVGLAGLSLLAAESGNEPLLCVVDDAQWIDAESLGTLAFIGRRVSAEGIVLLIAVRTPFDVPSELAGISTMEVRGLPAEEARDLLARVAGRKLDVDVMTRIVTEMNGCPLALKELGKELADSYIADQRAPVEQVTIRHRLEDHFFQQIADLPPGTQLLLLVAAADTLGDSALIWKVARLLGCGVDAQLIAEQRRLLLPGPELRFRHPLVRSTVYARVEPDQRREVHRALADAMGKDAFPDRWARHVALGSAGPSEELAAELEATSQMAQARGGYWSQASLLVQAANLSVSMDARSMRLLGAASAALNAGAFPYSAQLLDQAEPYLSDPSTLAEVAYLRGRLAIGLTQSPKAPALLLTASSAFLPLDMQKARDVLLETFNAYSISGRFTETISPRDIADLAKQTRTTANPPTLQDNLLDGMTALFSDDQKGAYGYYRRAGELIRSGVVAEDEIAKWASFVPLVLIETFDDAAYNVWVAQADAYARQNSALFLLLLNSFARMHADVRSGRLRGAAQWHAEALDVAAAIGLPAEFFLTMDNIVRAWRGDEEGTRAAATAAIEINSAIGSDQVVTMAHWALAILHVGAGRYEDALAETDYICAQSIIGYAAEALPVAVEAAVRCGQIEKARRTFADLEARVLASGTPWALGVLARSKALLTETSEAGQLYADAIDLLLQTSMEPDVARTRLLYGEWLRRKRRRVEARVQLNMAYEYFSEIGATSFAKRAEAELLATGARTRPRSVEHTMDLTAQEQRIAALASEGLSNREIAAQIFISSATVEYHLGKVYRKLGINSRGRLKRALDPVDLGQS